MEIELAKGTKNVDPQQKLIRNRVINVLMSLFERYGFLPLETPTLQRFEVLASKYAGGAEILKETFKLQDQGKRDLALRYDLTVPLALYVAVNPQVKLPFKRYEIGKVFRDGPISVERFREFWQCDIDIVGTSSLLAEAELLELAQQAFKELQLNVTIKVNNRKILDGIMENAKIPQEQTESVILTIDKLEKIGEAGVRKELLEKGLKEPEIKQALKLILLEGNNQKKLTELKKTLKNNQGIQEMETLLKYVENIEFDPSLARGLAYYTGTIFEVKLNTPEVKVSIASGGRYDKMIGEFLKNNQQYPAVGFSFGLDRIERAVQTTEKTTTLIYLIPIKQIEATRNLVKKLRTIGINAEMDLMERSISKNLDYANVMGIPYVVIIGEDEVKQKKYKLKEMKTGKENFYTEEDLIKELKKHAK